MTAVAALEMLNVEQAALLGQAELSEMEVLEADFDTVLEAAPSIKGAMKVHGAASRDLWMCDPAVLKIIKGFNPRVFTARYKKRIEEYAESMLANGWYPNSVLNGYTAVENDETVIYITSGHTRLLALAKANEKAAALGLPQILEVPVTVKTKGVSMDDLQVELIRGNADQSLTPYETGVVVQRLVRAGYDDEQIEFRTGVKNPWLGKLLKLMAAPNKLKLLVAHEYVTATLAIDLIEEYKGKALEVIENAMAKKAGVTDGKEVQPVSITKRDVITPEQRTAKAVSKFAPSMHKTLSSIYADPGVMKLRPDTQAMLAELMADLKKAQEKAGGVEASGQADPNQATIVDAEAPAAA